MNSFKILPIADDHDVSDTVYLCASYDIAGTPHELWVGDASGGAISVLIGVGYERATLEAILADIDILRELRDASASWEDEFFTTCKYEENIECILRDYDPDWPEMECGDYGDETAREYVCECVRDGVDPSAEYLADYLIEMAYADKIRLTNNLHRRCQYWIEELLPVVVGDYLADCGRAYTYDDPDGPVYAITYTDKWLEIGCQAHHIDTWRGFTDADIRAVGCQGDVALWRQHRLAIFAAMARYNSQFGK